MLDRSNLVVVFASLAFACGPSTRRGVGDDNSSDGGDDDANSMGSNPGSGCTTTSSCFTVYAHSDTVLYSVDLQSKTLTVVGPFNAPIVGSGSDAEPDPMTDLAVAPDNTIYLTSETHLYTASPSDGHVTSIGTLSACGSKAVALTTTPDGRLWTGDFSGKLCQIDTTTNPPTVMAPLAMGSNTALSGDFAAVSNGTVFGTAYRLADPSGSGTQANNLLVTIDMTTGAVTEIGSTGFPKLFGVAFAQGQVFGFTHDGTGRVVTIDPTTGSGTLYGTFSDPSTNKPISFGGAGVNSMVTIQ
jgi:hypothetical protein